MSRLVSRRSPVDAPPAGAGRGLRAQYTVLLHLTFVVSALLLGVLDKILFAAHREE